MQSFLTITDKSQFTEAEVAGWSAQKLRMMGQYFPGVTSITPELSAWLGSRTMKDADRDFFNVLSGRVEEGKKVGLGQYEELLFPKNGWAFYKPDCTILNFSDGTTTTVDSNPIPVPPEIAARKFVQPLACIVGAMFDVQGGQVISVVNFQTWRERFKSKNVAINVNGFSRCRTAVSEVLKSHPSWGTLLKESWTLKGLNFDQYFMEAASFCSWEDYFGIHSTFATSFIRFGKVLKQGEGDSARTLVVRDTWTDDTGQMKEFVEKGSVIVVSKEGLTGDVLKGWEAFFHKSGGIKPMMLVGPFPTTHNFSNPTDASLEEAVKANLTGNAFRGGDSRGIGAMVSSIGYSGGQSYNTRRRVSLISIALGLVMQNKAVEISCSVSDVVQIRASMKHFAPTSDFSLLCSVDDYAKLNEKDLSCVTFTPTRSRIGVRYSVEGVPTVPSDSRAQTVFDAKTKQWIDRCYAYHDKFVVVLPIVSAKFFGKNKVKKDEKIEEEDFSVFVLREPWDFVGIFTNLGDGSSALKEAYADKPDQVLYRDFVRMESFVGWCSAVIRANGAMNSWFLRPRVFFNPVSNLIKSPTKGYKAILGADGDMQYTIVPQVNWEQTGGVVDRHGDEVDAQGVPLLSLMSQPTDTRPTASVLLPSTTQEMEGQVVGGLGVAAGPNSASPSSVNLTPNVSAQSLQVAAAPKEDENVPEDTAVTF